MNFIAGYAVGFGNYCLESEWLSPTLVNQFRREMCQHLGIVRIQAMLAVE